MAKRTVDSPNGKERRSGKDRRDPKRKSERGALTTRTGVRRLRDRPVKPKSER